MSWTEKLNWRKKLILQKARRIKHNVEIKELAFTSPVVRAKEGHLRTFKNSRLSQSNDSGKNWIDKET